MTARTRHKLRQWRSLAGLITLLLSAGCGDERIRLGRGSDSQANPEDANGIGARSSNGGSSNSGGSLGIGGGSLGVGGAGGVGGALGGSGGTVGSAGTGALGGSGGAVGSAGEGALGGGSGGAVGSTGAGALGGSGGTVGSAGAGALDGSGGTVGSAGAGSSMCAGKLFGVSAYGEASEWRSLQVDLATGATTTLAVDPRIAHVDPAGTFDPGTGRVYARGGFRSGESNAGLLAFDAATGALVAAAPLDEGVFVIEIGRDGRLFGVSAGVDAFYFGVVDLATGALQTLDSFPPVVGMAIRSSAYDPARNLFYQPGFVTGWQPTLFAVDASTGAVSFSTPSEELSGLKVDARGGLVGFAFSSAGWRVSSIDPRSGKSVPFNQTPVVDLAGETAIDVEAGIVLVQTLDDSTEQAATIRGIDIATGDVQKLVTLDRALNALELVESCRPRR